MPESMRDRFVDVTGDLMDRDPMVVAVLAVISHGLFDERGVAARHPERIIDVGIREQAQLGVAGGLALEGYLPIVTGYAPFLVERPFEQIKISLTHQQVRAVLVSVGASWDSSGSGRTHHAPEDIALMATLPGWDIHVPGHADEVEALLRHAHTSKRSTYLRTTVDANSRSYLGVPGRIVTLRRGTPSAPTVMAVGPVADAAVAGLADLDATILYTATASPLDRRGLRASVLGTDVVLIEPYLAGTSAGRVAEALSDRPIRLRSHGTALAELHHYGTPAEHRAAHGLDARGIRSFVTEAFSGGAVELGS